MILAFKWNTYLSEHTYGSAPYAMNILFCNEDSGVRQAAALLAGFDTIQCNFMRASFPDLEETHESAGYTGKRV